MSIQNALYKPIVNIARGAKKSLQYGGEAANRLCKEKKGLKGVIVRKRVQLESVRRNKPEYFYPAAGFCSGIPGGTSMGFLIGLAVKFFKKFK